jgi:hypothetical protein
MNLWRRLFGRRGGSARSEQASIKAATPQAAAAAPPEIAAPQTTAGISGPEASETEPEVSAPSVVVPPQTAAQDPAGVGLEEEQPEVSDEPSEEEPQSAAAGHDSAPEARYSSADYESEDTEETEGPEPEISALRLDEALKRLREENPATSEDSPPAPSG